MPCPLPRTLAAACISALLVCSLCAAGADWRPDKLSTCSLHPAIESLLINETRVWGDGGITEDLVRSLHDNCPPNNTRTHACIKSQRILIKDGTVYLTSLMPTNGFGHIELIGFLVELYEASQVFRLPDVEFAYWHDDNAPSEAVRQPDGRWSWPFPPHGLPPILSWSKAKMHGSLLVPYCGAFRCPRDSFDAIVGEVQHLAGVPWSARKEVAFGRWNVFCAWYYRGAHRLQDGTASPCPRQYYSEVLYVRHPEKLITAALQQNTTDGLPAAPVSLSEQHKFKYLVSTDGWSISSKFDKYLLLGSLIFKSEGLTYGFYYPALEPYKHYVPTMLKHKDDILEALEWARSHDSEAQEIAKAAQRLAMRNLNRQARLCYLFRLLTELSKQMRFPVDCARRPVCVPLVEEIKFLSRHHLTRTKCRYEEVLIPWAHDDPAALPGDTGYADLVRQHEALPPYVMFGRRRRRRRSS